MRRFGLALASLGLFLCTGIGAANAQTATLDAPREFFGYAPAMTAPAPSEWFIQGDRLEVQQAALAPSCMAPIIKTVATTCAAPVVAPVATCAPVKTCAPVATCAPLVCGPRECDNPGLHGINGSLQVQPTVGFRGNNLIIQPTASLIGGNNPYLAPVVQNSVGIIQPTLGVDYTTNVMPTTFIGAAGSPIIIDRNF